MMRGLFILFLGVSGLYAADGDEAFVKTIRPLLKERCISCHSTEKQKGDLDLERFASFEDILKEPTVWEHVQEQIHIGEMPPKKEPPLSPKEKELLTTWVQSTLDVIALASAGDPGPVVLRRLSNQEYTYTIRDLTGVASLDPAREFPVDGAAGEGFTNAGAALVMSPALLTKYLDAAKGIADHLVLTPTGFRFSAHTSFQDWTDETLAAIRAFYSRFTTSGNATPVDLQGVKFDTNAGGLLPVGDYLAALQGKRKSDDLNKKYLATLNAALTGTTPSLLLDPMRAKFREGTLAAADIEAWQRSLWRFASVGHIGKKDGPKAWQEPVSPLVSVHEMRLKVNPPEESGDLTLYLSTSDAGDGSGHDEVAWENPRLVAPGKPDVPVGDIAAFLTHLEAEKARVIATAEQCLSVLAGGEHEVDPALLVDWQEYLGLGNTTLEPLLAKPLKSVPDYDFIKGWTGENALSVLANSSDTTVRTPGVMKAHSVATHPSPTLASVIAWRSEVTGTLKITGDVLDAHPECGNGVTWALEVRRGPSRETLASGVTNGATLIPMGPFEKVSVRSGDVVALVIGPREGNHVCDLTAINLTLSDGARTWDLAKEVSPNILAGNPHGAWHFLSQSASLETAPDLPAPLAEWRRAPGAGLAAKVRQHLEHEMPLNHPLLRHAFVSFKGKSVLTSKAPLTEELRIPAALARGTEFVVTGRLTSKTEGSVQMQVSTSKPASPGGITAGSTESAQASGKWSDNNLRTRYSAPVIVNDASSERQKFEAAFDEFRALFPIALCYSKIVPVDEVVTLTLFHREDDHLKRLMLDGTQVAELDRLWEELRLVSESPLKEVDVFEQLYQFATQDADPSAFEPMREPIRREAVAFKKWLIELEPAQVSAVLDFATQAWRRPLVESERANLEALYESLRQQELPHAAAVRLLFARVLVAPDFLYRGEKATPGTKASPVNDFELATRLSYFLWASAPDDELRSLAAAGKLRDPAVLGAQTRRLMQDSRIRRLATEFGCQWLHVRDLETLDEKSERHFSTFAGLRGDMQEEAVRFFMDVFQNDRSVLSLLNADHTFVNGPLAGHYGFEVTTDTWQRIDGLRAKGRGGILGFAATLAKQSGASRTSPILRGTWLSEVILGDKLPNPPKGVPVLPEEAPEGLTERQLTERHSSDERCASCHRRVDPFGFALEGFDAIGRARTKDAAGLAINTGTILPDGTAIEGLDGLRTWLVNDHREDFTRQFCRKLLGYALGRGVQLSDRPLIDAMLVSGESNEFRVGAIIEAIVQSPQFREVRGRDFMVN